MTRSDGPGDEIWNTREELLLACAVSRHGTHRWDSVAGEVRSRSPFSHLPTAQTCKRRYHDLQRRFAADLPGMMDATTKPAPMSVLEGLRQLRVAELRREVERYDASIVSLQLKVERLKEDRERSLQSEQSGDKSDLPEVVGAKEEAASPPSSLGNLGVDGANAGDSRRSCNESNTTEPKQGNNSCAAEGTARNGVTRADPATGYDEKFACEGSYNGSSETVAKGSSAEAATPAEDQATANPTPPPDAGESGESVTESKGEASKESSDFQSSASLPRRRRGRRKAPSGASSGGEEAEADAISPSSAREPTKSQPLATFLQKIRSHKQAASFQRRLESQGSARYRSLIRQHMDLGTVQSKMDEGAYVADAEFYRDLLLICTNAVVFFAGNSAEHAAGARLRRLVRKQIRSVTRKPAPTPPAAAEEAAVVSSPVAPEAKVEQDLQGSLLDKSISTAPLVACRKRSFIAGKTNGKVPAAAKVEEKPDAEKKGAANTEKKRTRERSATVGTRGLRTSKTRSNSSVTAGGAGKNTTPATASASASAGNVALSTKMDRKSAANGTAAAANSVAKKRCAVNFLSRINRGGLSSAHGTLRDTLKSAGDGVKGGAEPKRRGKAKEGREQGTKQASGAGGSVKHARGQTLPVKRGVGRPPKRPLPPLPTPPAKRARGVEADLSAPTRASASKKRGRR